MAAALKIDLFNLMVFCYLVENLWPQTSLVSDKIGIFDQFVTIYYITGTTVPAVQLLQNEQGNVRLA